MGVTGLVLNKPENATLRQVLKAWPHTVDDALFQGVGADKVLDRHFYQGGPVIVGNTITDSMRWLHKYGDKVPGAREVVPSVWIGGSLPSVLEQAREDPDSVRFFLGFSGWAFSQLCVELESGVWVRARAAEANVHGELSFSSEKS